MLKQEVRDNWVFWRPLAHGVVTLEDLFGPPPYKTGYPFTWVLKASYALEIKSEREQEQIEEQKKKSKRNAKKQTPNKRKIHTP